VAGLPQVTGEAATDDVVPFVTTSPALGNDVVEGDVLAFTAAVLTGVLVAVEHLEAGETLLEAGALDELGEADHRRDGDRGTYGMEFASTVLDHLCLAIDDEYHGSADPADVQRFEVLVQDQHWDVGLIH